MADNGVIMQFFQWYTPADGSLWRESAARAAELSRDGFIASGLLHAANAQAAPAMWAKDERALKRTSPCASH